jgi:GR25 family glycosyltransferase involved in LPS biosynthesis
MPCPYYYINMPNSTDRRSRMESRFSFSQYPLTRIVAITPQTLPPIVVPSKSRESIKEFACVMSHLKAIHTAYKNKDSYAIIMEDDVIPLRNMNLFYLFKIAHKQDKKWNIIQLYTVVHSWNHFESPLLCRSIPNFTWGLGIYLINRKGMKHILKYYNMLDYEWDQINPVPVKFPSSVLPFVSEVAVLWASPKIRSYVLSDAMYVTEDFDSLIHPDHLTPRLSEKEIFWKLLKKGPKDPSLGEWIYPLSRSVLAEKKDKALKQQTFYSFPFSMCW